MKFSQTSLLRNVTVVTGLAIASSSNEALAPEAPITELRNDIYRSVADGLNCADIVQRHNEILEDWHEDCMQGNFDRLMDSIVLQPDGRHLATIEIEDLQNCRSFLRDRLPLDITEQYLAMETAQPDINFAKDILNAGPEAYNSLSLLSRYVVDFSVRNNIAEFTPQEVEIAISFNIIPQ